jgi:hypothetical protein
MISRDGKYKIYCIQHAPKKTGDWVFTDDKIVAEIPIEIRYGGEGNAQRGKLIEPIHSYSSSGHCWQETGVHGVYDEELAIQLLMLLARHVPEHAYRVVQIEIEQKTTEIASASFAKREPSCSMLPRVAINSRPVVAA